jgi:hypothetical protein
VPGALGKVGNLVRQLGDVQLSRGVDDRHQQPALGVHRDAEVLLAVVDDLVAVDPGVHHRVLLQGLDAGPGEER